MSIINIKYLLRNFLSSIATWPWKFDSFLELASKPRMEIAICDGGYSLYRNCDINRSLQEQEPSLNSVSLEVICSSLKTGDVIVLSIDEKQCFIQQLEVPNITMAKIASILDFELAKTTPFNKEQVYMGWQKQNSSIRSDFQNITQYVMRRDFFNGSVRALSSKGVQTQAVIVRGKDGTCVHFALSENGESFERARAQAWSKAAIFGSGVVAVLTIVLATTFQQSQAKLSGFIDANTESFVKDAVYVRKKIDGANAGRTEFGALHTKVSASTKKSIVIEEISRILSDDSYVDGLTISGDKATLDGAATNPERLIALLEASPHLSGVAFNTPSFRNSGEEKSRFSIKFNIVPDGG